MFVPCKFCHEMIDRQWETDADYPEIEWATYRHLFPVLTCNDYIERKEAH